MTLNELTQKAHQNAVKHGFWSGRESNEHAIALIITEIAEMIEADRKGHHADMVSYQQLSKTGGFDKEAFDMFVDHTVECEMADAVLRLHDLAGAIRLDFDKMRESNYHRDFERFSFTENAYGLIKGLTAPNHSLESRIVFAIYYLHDWADYMGIDLEEIISLKMYYNEGRPINHGKKY